MVEPAELVLGAILLLVVARALQPLISVAKAFGALRRRPTATAANLNPGEPVSIEGEVFVKKPATAADAIFDDTTGDVGAYLWRAAFIKGGSYVYDFDHSELRSVRRSFATGLETECVGISTGGRHLSLDLSWLHRVYDTTPLSEVTVGDHRSNLSLPLGLSQRLFDSPYVHLKTTVDEAPSERLAHLIDIQIHDNRTDEFVVDARGVTAGQRLFVSGVVQTEDGTLTVAGTADSPLLVSDTGANGLRRHLLWLAVKKVVLIAAVLGVGVLFLV